jgi:hypothetical protein
MGPFEETVRLAFPLTMRGRVAGYGVKKGHFDQHGITGALMRGQFGIQNANAPIGTVVSLSAINGRAFSAPIPLDSMSMLGSGRSTEHDHKVVAARNRFIWETLNSGLFYDSTGIN